MGKFWKLLVMLIILIGYSSSGVEAREIQTVQLEISYPQNIDVAVQKRMQASLLPITEQVLVGRTVQEIIPDKMVYQELFKDIVNRTFTGYQVASINLDLAEQSRLQVKLQAWGETITGVKMNFDYSGVQELWQPLIAAQALKATAQVPLIFQGMPIEATFWLNSVARERVYQQAQKYLPAFKVVTQLHGEKEPEFDVTIIPVGQEVQTVNLTMYSKNIPKLLMLESKNKFQRTVNTLRGLPLEFIRENQVAIKEILIKELLQDKFIARYKLFNSLNLIIAENLQVEVQLDLADYNFWLEGYLDLGRSEKSSSGKMHIGYDLSKNNEILLETSLYTDSMQFDVDLGIAQRYKKTTATYLRRVNSHEDIFRLQHQFNRDWGLRIERKPAEHENEFALSYRVHEFFTAEYVFSNKERYFRIVTRL